MAKVPDPLVEHFLLGRATPGEPQRFTQDGGIVAEVWLHFAKDLAKPRRILFTPIDGLPAIEAASVVHEAIEGYRKELPTTSMEAVESTKPTVGLQAGIPESREPANVAPLESYVAVTLYFDELLRVLLPLTQWWGSRNLGSVRDQPQARSELREKLEDYVSHRLGHLDAPASPLAVPVPVPVLEPGDPRQRRADWKVLQATPIVALIGLFLAVADNPTMLDAEADTPAPVDDETRAAWIIRHARPIARAAVSELRRPPEPAIAAALANLPPPPRPREGDAIIQRVFLDRECHLAESPAICTVKADAADRVFNITCQSITWAILDSGIAATHPAFDEFEAGPDGGQTRLAGRRRVRATYDLTLIYRIRNLDLTIDDPIRREAVIVDIIRDLVALPGTRAANFRQVATDNLNLIAEQLRRRLLPDWSLIEPLIRVQEDDGQGLASDHGTHVAGILGADWREPRPGAPPGAPEEVILRGICPDISLYDLRVLHPKSIKNTEFAVIGALEFVRHLNSRASGPPVIHGVNISLSIPHEVRNYGCGATPLCVACDDLVHSGVVVVAAAGNRGWNERELGFGNFVFCSITDPGNAQQVITVGATHGEKPHTYGVSYFSSRGPTGDGRVKPDIVAPGEKIRGPIRGGAEDELDGTSMAAPFVSGAAAMLMARHGELMRNPQRIKEILCASATDLGRERYFQGHGLVDVLRALQSV